MELLEPRWSEASVDALSVVVNHCGLLPHHVAAARRSCSAWKAAVDGTLLELRPRCRRLSDFIAIPHTFRMLRHLDLSMLDHSLFNHQLLFSSTSKVLVLFVANLRHMPSLTTLTISSEFAQEMGRKAWAQHVCQRLLGSTSRGNTSHQPSSTAHSTNPASPRGYVVADEDGNRAAQRHGSIASSIGSGTMIVAGSTTAAHEVASSSGNSCGSSGSSSCGSNFLVTSSIEGQFEPCSSAGRSGGSDVDTLVTGSGAHIRSITTADVLPPPSAPNGPQVGHINVCCPADNDQAAVADVRSLHTGSGCSVAAPMDARHRTSDPQCDPTDSTCSSTQCSSGDRSCSSRQGSEDVTWLSRAAAVLCLRHYGSREVVDASAVSHISTDVPPPGGVRDDCTASVQKLQLAGQYGDAVGSSTSTQLHDDSDAAGEDATRSSAPSSAAAGETSLTPQSQQQQQQQQRHPDHGGQDMMASPPCASEPVVASLPHTGSSCSLQLEGLSSGPAVAVAWRSEALRLDADCSLERGSCPLMPQQEWGTALGASDLILLEDACSLALSDCDTPSPATRSHPPPSQAAATAAAAAAAATAAMAAADAATVAARTEPAADVAVSRIMAGLSLAASASPPACDTQGAAGSCFSNVLQPDVIATCRRPGDTPSAPDEPVAAAAAATSAVAAAPALNATAAAAATSATTAAAAASVLPAAAAADAVPGPVAAAAAPSATGRTAAAVTASVEDDFELLFSRRQADSPGATFQSMMWLPADWLTQLPGLQHLVVQPSRRDAVPFYEPYGRHRRTTPPIIVWFKPSLMTGLKTLTLSGTPLGALPAEFGRLGGVRRMDLANCDIQALPESLAGLTSLIELDLSGNIMTVFPGSVGEMSALRRLNLARNMITAVPTAIRKLQSLEELYLNNNQLKDLAPEVGQLTRLQALDVSCNWLCGLPAFSELCSLQQLTRLAMQGITDSTSAVCLAPQITQLRALQHVDLSGNNIHAQALQYLGSVTSLTSLALRESALTALPPHLTRLNGLQVLDLSGNPLPSRVREALRTAFRAAIVEFHL